MVSRRSLLAVAGVGVGTLLSGCLASTPSDSSGGGNGLTTEVIVDDNDSVEEDAWRNYQFRLNREATVSVETTVRRGPAMDFYMMNPEEYRNFDNGNRFRFVSALSRGDTTGYSGEGRLPSGEYVLVADNSNRGEAAPPTNFSDDVATFDVRITARL